MSTVQVSDDRSGSSIEDHQSNDGQVLLGTMRDCDGVVQQQLNNVDHPQKHPHTQHHHHHHQQQQQLQSLAYHSSSSVAGYDEPRPLLLADNTHWTVDVINVFFTFFIQVAFLRFLTFVFFYFSTFLYTTFIHQIMGVGKIHKCATNNLTHTQRNTFKIVHAQFIHMTNERLITVTCLFPFCSLNNYQYHSYSLFKKRCQMQSMNMLKSNEKYFYRMPQQWFFYWFWFVT